MHSVQQQSRHALKVPAQTVLVTHRCEHQGFVALEHTTGKFPDNTRFGGIVIYTISFRTRKDSVHRRLPDRTRQYWWLQKLVVVSKNGHIVVGKSNLTWMTRGHGFRTKMQTNEWTVADIADQQMCDNHESTGKFATFNAIVQCCVINKNLNHCPRHAQNNMSGKKNYGSYAFQYITYK